MEKIHSIERKTMERDKQIGRLIGSYFVITLSYNIFRRIFLLGTKACMIFLAMLLIGLVLCNYRIIISILKKKAALILLCVLIVFLMYNISYIKGGVSVKTIITYVSYSLFLCMPFFLAGMMIKNKRNVYEELKKISYLILLIGILIIFSRSGDEYNMVYSYRMLLPLLIYTNEFLDNKKLRYLVLALLVFGLIIIYGSRGSLLCFGLFCILRLFLCKKNTLLKIISMVVAGVVVACYEGIGKIVIQFMDKYGIQNRTLRLLFTNLMYVSGRDNIQKEAFELLNQHKWTGLGVASDMDLIGYYPHNILVEILYDYGYVIGSIGIIGLFACLLWFLVQDDRDVTIMFLAIGFFPMLLSGSYLIEPMFWLLIGIIIGQIRLKNNCRKNNLWKRNREVDVY